MRFFACVGVLPREREIPQPIDIDVTVELASGSAPAGATIPVLDYRQLYEIAHDAVKPDHTELLEQIATRIADRVFGLPDVASVKVAVRKPEVPLPGPLAFAEVVLERGERG
jgi:dihydroneopterin aldolase